MKQSESVGIVSNHFEALGFKVIYIPGKDSTNGPDLWVVKNGRPVSVEIKIARVKAKGELEVTPVTKNRMNDDLIAIVIENYVLIEPMKDHLKCCSKGGTRGLTPLLGIRN